MSILTNSPSPNNLPAREPVVFQLERMSNGELAWTYHFYAIIGRFGSLLRERRYAGPVDGQADVEQLRAIGCKCDRQPVMRYYPDTWAWDCAQ